MALQGYGVLFGTIVSARSPQGRNAHWVLLVQPNDLSHPAYRVAVKLSAADGSIQGQVLDLASGSAVARAFAQTLREAKDAHTSFLRADDASAGPGATHDGLDYVRSGIVDLSPGAFRAVVDDPTDPVQKAFARGIRSKGVKVAVYGTGAPLDRAGGAPAATGFTGVENVHMNQGSRNQVGGSGHHVENAANQDGALFFISRTGVTGVFLKFASQSLRTNREGIAIDTAIREIERAREPAQPVLAARAAAEGVLRDRLAEAGRTAGAAAGASPGGFTFADPDDEHAHGAYVPDVDDGARTAPITVQYAHGSTKGPVPDPRRYSVMNLSEVVATDAIVRAGAISFDLIGDSGAATQAKLKGEDSVTARMCEDAKADPPAFLHHVGDVVYYYGEEDYYYSQFYEPFQHYPAPIFAIPGNHDGIIYKEGMVSLAAFKAAFCADKPGRWAGAGGILRSTMTQPGVYFTLDAPFVSIIGLYSNCSESFPWLDDHQFVFLQNELKRMKALRDGQAFANGPAGPDDARPGEPRAVILAIHHCPRWYVEPEDPIAAGIDAACRTAGLWPDLVICGHAHLYQRFVRAVDGREIPYVINGGGGYGIVPAQQLGRGTLPSNKTVFAEGYIRARADARQLALEYRRAKQEDGAPAAADTIRIDLATHQVSLG